MGTSMLNISEKFSMNVPVETMEGQSSSTSAIDTQVETGIATND